LKISTRNFRWWIPVLIWLTGIGLESFRMSSNVTVGWLGRLCHLLHLRVSDTALMELNHILRKAGHVTGYGILCLLVFRACFHSAASVHPLSNGLSRVRCSVFALSLTLITAVLDEWHQSFDPSRTSSAWDVGIDMTGAVVFLAFTLFVLRLWQKAPTALNHAAQSAEC
jgi:VanZ family protein